MRRDLRQMSLADGLVNQRAGRNDWLGEIDKILDWAVIAAVLGKIYNSDEGRPSYPVLTLVKLLLLQQWYCLSDPGLEEAVDDRLSFRRFAGLPLDEGVPDHSTIWRFRQELERHGLSEALFAEINRQLDARGLIVRKGTLIDATIVQAAVKPPSMDEGTVLRARSRGGLDQEEQREPFRLQGSCRHRPGVRPDPRRHPDRRRPARQLGRPVAGPGRRGGRLRRQSLRQPEVP